MRTRLRLFYPLTLVREGRPFPIFQHRLLDGKGAAVAALASIASKDDGSASSQPLFALFEPGQYEAMLAARAAVSSFGTDHHLEIPKVRSQSFKRQQGILGGLLGVPRIVRAGKEYIERRLRRLAAHGHRRVILAVDFDERDFKWFQVLLQPTDGSLALRKHRDQHTVPVSGVTDGDF